MTLAHSTSALDVLLLRNCRAQSEKQISPNKNHYTIQINIHTKQNHTTQLKMKVYTPLLMLLLVLRKT